MKLNMKGAVGILAAGTAAGLIMLGGPSSQKAEDGKKRIILQEEIVSLRQENVKVFATNRADTRVAHVYAKPVHYRDKRTGELREYDLSVKISKADDPERFVDIGNGRVTWREGSESDYRFEDGSGHYVAYRFLTDARGIEVQNEYGKGGVKQSYILESDGAGSELAWQIETNLDCEADGGGLVFTDGGSGRVIFRTAAPVAWDADGKPVNVAVTASCGMLIYDIDTEGARYPVTVDPSTKIESYGNDGRVISENAAYLTARNATTGATVNTWLYCYVGQNRGAQYTVHRSFLNFPPVYNVASVLSESLYVKVQSDQSTTNFDFFPVQGTFTGAPSTGWFNDFLGWLSSGTYGTNTMSNYFDTGAGSWAGETWKYVAFIAAGRDTTKNVWARGDTLRLMLISARDNSATEPTNTEYVVLYNSDTAGKEPYLSITYTLAVPTGFIMTASGTDSVYCAWNNNIAGEDSFRVKDAVTGAYVGSVAADVTTFAKGGLIPDTIYDWLVEVVGGNADGQTSAPDSVCTDAAAPVAAPDTSDVTYTTMTVYPDTSGTGNPEDTDYAIVFITTDYDTLYVDASADPDTLREALGVEDEWGWRTYDEWGGAGGVMVTGLDPARTYAVGVMARRRDFPE